MENELEKALSLLKNTSDWCYQGFCHLWQGWFQIEDNKREPHEIKRRSKAMACYS
ncbi:MAG: hypothetical protein HW380_450 [Magnetococcales bacterium]|nr:hypothetical protein [Magnetococcales bacterium]